MVKVVFDLHVAALLALARCDGCLDAYLMAQRTEEWWSCVTAQSWAWVDAATDWQQCTWSGWVPRKCFFFQAHSMRGWFTRIGIGTPRAPEKKVCQRLRGQ